MSEKNVVYIMGRGRSGSTILDALIATSPDAICVGELVTAMQPGASRVSKSRCGCGAEYRTCAFWQGVRSDFEKRAGVSWQEAEVLTSQYAHPRRFLETLTNSRHHGSLTRLVRVTDAVFDSISAISHKGLIVDSSKAITRGLFLLRFIRGTKIVHLVRHPVDTVASYYHMISTGKSFPLFHRKYRNRSMTPLYMFLISLAWVVGNFLSEWVHWAAPSRVLRVRYEDLCRHPKQQLRRLQRFIGCDLTTADQAIDRNFPLSLGHHVGGNPYLRKKSEVVFGQGVQQHKLPGLYRWMAVLITFPLMVFYGYRPSHG